MAKTLTIQEQLQKLIQSLGSTPAEVAKSLIDIGVTGTPNKLGNGPIPNFVRQILQNSAQVESVVVNKRVVVKVTIGKSSVYVPLPKHMTQFQKSFDNGRYPTLVTRRA